MPAKTNHQIRTVIACGPTQIQPPEVSDFFPSGTLGCRQCWGDGYIEDDGGFLPCPSCTNWASSRALEMWT